MRKYEIVRLIEIVYDKKELDKTFGAYMCLMEYLKRKKYFNEEYRPTSKTIKLLKQYGINIPNVTTNI